MEEVNFIKKEKSKGILVIFVIILGLSLSLGALYFMYYQKDSRNNNIQSGLIKIDYEDVSVSVNSNLPVTDEVGMNGTPYIFKVTNKSNIPIDVDIKLHVNRENTNIDLNAIKYGLYINNNFIKKDFIRDNGNDTITIHTYNNLTVDETINCKLYLWTDYYYETPNRTFEALIEVTGVSTNVIDN